MLDDEISNKVSPPISVNDVKDHMNNLLSIRWLIEDESYHVPLRKPFMHLRRLICSRKADYVVDSFQQWILLTRDEIGYSQFMRNLWLIKLLGITQSQVQNCLDTYREEMQDFQRKNKHNDSGAIARYEHNSQPAQRSKWEEPLDQHILIININSPGCTTLRPKMKVFSTHYESLPLGL